MAQYDELEVRIRRLEIMVAEHEVEMRKRWPLIIKAYEGMKEVTTILRGTLGAEGFVNRMSTKSEQFEAELKQVRKRQYLTLGGIAVLGVLIPVFIKFLT